MQTTHTGVVKFFNKTKGWGFIVNDAKKGQELFVHSSGLSDDIKENDKVAFNVEDTPKGLTCVDVFIIK